MGATRFGVLVAAFVVGGLGAWGVDSALAQEGDRPVQGVVERLVGQLGADDFDARERAEKRLVQLGAKAVPALRRAAKSEDAEVRRRARRALARIKDARTPPKVEPPDRFEPPKGWQRLPRGNGGQGGGDPMQDLWRRMFGGAGPRGGTDPFADMHKMFDELLRGFGAAPGRPRAPRANPADPFQDLFRGLFGGGGGQADPFRGLDKMLQDLMKEGGLPFRARPADPDAAKRFADAQRQAREQLRRLFGEGGMFGNRDPFAGLPDLQRLLDRARRGGMQRAPHGSRRSMSMGPNGVSVTLIEGKTRISVTKNADGVRVSLTEPDQAGVLRTTEWTAASEAELRSKHPAGAKAYDRAMGGIRFSWSGKGRTRAPFRLRRPRSRQPGGRAKSLLGLTARPVSAALRAQLEIPEGRGLYVDRVEPGSWASRAGIHAHDVLLAIDGKALASLKTLEDGSGDDSAHTIQLLRLGQPQSLTVAAARKK